MPTGAQLFAGIRMGWWYAIALVLLLIIAQESPRIGGWLLIVVVLGMLYAGQQREDRGVL